MDIDKCINEKILTAIKLEPENDDQNILNYGHNCTENDANEFFIKTEEYEFKLKSEEKWDKRSTHDRVNTCIEEEIYPVSLSRIKQEEENEQDMVKYRNNFIENDRTDLLIKNEEIYIKSEEFTENERYVKSESEPCRLVWSSNLSETSLVADQHSRADQDSTNKSEISTELPIYKCAMCPYQNKKKRYLKDHILRRHSNLKPYECGICSYKTKQKKCLNHHMFTHLRPSDRRVYKCDFCPYEVKNKQSLHIHLQTHKNPSEVKMYRCDLCPYQGVAKCYLNKHMICHKSIDEIKVYECDVCKYKFKDKFRLTQHRLRRNKCTRKE